MLSLDLSEQKHSSTLGNRKENLQNYFVALRRQRELRDIFLKRTNAAVCLQRFCRAYRDLQKEKHKRLDFLLSLNGVELLRNFFFVFFSIKTQYAYYSILYNTSESYGLPIFYSHLALQAHASPSTYSSSDTTTQKDCDREKSELSKSSVTPQRFPKYLNQLRENCNDIISGRQFFSTTKVVSKRIFVQQPPSSLPVVDAACRLALWEYRCRFPRLKSQQRTFFLSSILPKAYNMLRCQQLTPPLGYKVLFTLLTHCPCLLQRWGIHAAFTWNNSLTVDVCLALLQGYPSMTSKLLVYFDMVPVYLKNGYLGSTTVSVIIKTLQDSSCIWQCRLAISIACCVVYYQLPVYQKIQEELDECLLRLFSETPERFTQLFNEYFGILMCTKRCILSRLDTKEEPVCYKGGSDSVDSLSLSSSSFFSSSSSTINEFKVKQPKEAQLHKSLTTFNRSMKHQMLSTRPFENLLKSHREERGTKRFCLNGACMLSSNPLSVAEILTESIDSPGPLALQQFLYLYNGCFCDQIEHMREMSRFFSHIVHFMAVGHGALFLFIIGYLNTHLNSVCSLRDSTSSVKETIYYMMSKSFLQQLCQSPCFVHMASLGDNFLLSKLTQEPALCFPLMYLCEIYFPLQPNGWSALFFEKKTPKTLFSLKECNLRIDSETDDESYEEQEFSNQADSDWKDEWLGDHLKEACYKQDICYNSQVVKTLSQQNGFFYGVLALFQKEILKVMNKRTTLSLLETDDLRALCSQKCLHLCVVVSVLLESRLRPMETSASNLSYSLMLDESTLRHRFLDLSTLVVLLNHLTSVLIQDSFRTSSQITDDIKRKQCSALLLAHILRDLHRLKNDLFPDTMWVVPTRLLKSTQDLMDQAEKFRSQQYNFTNGETFRSHEMRPSNVTQHGTRDSVYALAVLLTHLPHSISFNDRSLILTLLIIDDKLRSFGLLCDNPFFLQHEAQFRIRRSNLIGDTIAALKNNTVSWRRPIAVTFVDYFGNQEKGVDGGGLFREYFTLLSRALFSPSFGLFEPLPDRTLIPSSTAYAKHGSLTKTLFHLSGTLVGKAIYEHILLEPMFNRVFLDKIQSLNSCHLEDLRFLDPELYKHLKGLDSYEDLENLQLTFSATVNRSEKQIEEVDLIPNGRRVLVCRDNVEVYKQAIACFHLNLKFSNEAEMFRDGLVSVIPLEWLKLFESSECSNLISGKEHCFDVDDLAAHVDYSGGFSCASPTIQFLWTLLRDMSMQRQRQFLMFVTGCSRPPFLGFRMLQPRFKIQQVDDINLLPTASTCVNQLNLPAYKTSSLLKEKLFAALEMAQGFELY